MKLSYDALISDIFIAAKEVATGLKCPHTAFQMSNVRDVLSESRSSDDNAKFVMKSLIWIKA